MDKTALSKKAYMLRLRSASLAEGMRSGSFKSLYKGRGIDFSGVREYLDGDDIRAIDWNVTARMGHTYVKQYEEERELNVFIALDSSLSMVSPAFSEKNGRTKKTRMETALECASLITLASFQNRSPIGSVFFDGEVYFTLPPKGGKEQMMVMLSALEKKVRSESQGSALSGALKTASEVLKKRTLILVFSDFKIAGWEKPLSKLCAKHDVVAVKIADSSDFELPPIGSIPFRDAESGKIMVLPTLSKKFKAEWKKQEAISTENWKHECIRRGAFPLIIGTESEPLVALTTFFSSRGKA